MKKTKVLIDTYQLRIAKTGIRKYVEELISICREYGSPSFEYYFYPYSGNEKSTVLKENKSLFSRLKEQWKYFYHKQIELPRMAEKENVDLVFLPDYYAPAKALKAHKMIVFHDAFFWESPAHYGKLWWLYFRKVIQKGLSGKSSVLTISEHSRSTIKGILPKMATIDVLHNACRESGPSDLHILKKLKLTRHEFFLHVGVFEERKNLDFLVEAFALFLEAAGPTEMKLVLVGAAPTGKTKNALPNLLAEVKRLGLNEHVLFPGYLTDTEISGLYQNAFAYVFPSKNEGFGYPILEAFAHCCPLLISDQPALLEVAGQGALTFPRNNSQVLCDRMMELYKSDELKNELVAKGSQRLKDFDRSAYMVKLERLMRSYATKNDE